MSTSERQKLPTVSADLPGIGQPTDATEGPAASPGFLLWRATLNWQRSLTHVLRPLKLTHVQFVLLASIWWLATQTEPANQLPSQRQIADHANTNVMMTSQVLRTLEMRGLITRRSDPADSRTKRLNVTHAGADLAQRAIAVVNDVDSTFFTHVEDRNQLLTMLTQLANAL